MVRNSYILYNYTTDIVIPTCLLSWVLFTSGTITSDDTNSSSVVPQANAQCTWAKEDEKKKGKKGVGT